MYNIGDYVKIKDDLVLAQQYNIMHYTASMNRIKYRYHTYKITNVQKCWFGYVYEINNEKSDPYFTDEMLEPAHYDKLKKFLEELCY